MLLPWVLCGVLSAVSFILCMKIHMLKVSMAEIRAQLADWLKTDTNTLISISSSDRQLRSRPKQATSAASQTTQTIP